MVMWLRAQVHFFAAARTEARTRTDILGEVKLSAHYRMTIRFLPFSHEIFGESPREGEGMEQLDRIAR